MVGKPTEPAASQPPREEIDPGAPHHGDAGPLTVERLRKDDGRDLILYTLPTGSSLDT